MSQRITQAELAAEVIDGLEDPTPGAIERATAEFPARSIASAAAAAASTGSGGSQPVILTFTASQITARYDSDSGYSYIEIPEFQPGMLVAACFRLADDLDSGVLDGFVAYEPGASTADVYANSEGFSVSIDGGYSPGTYSGAPVVLGAGRNAALLQEGAAAYVGFTSFTDDIPPATGSITIRFAFLT